MNLQDEINGTEPLLQHEKQLEESPVNTVVTTVAEVTDQSPLEMEPLCEAIDPDALNELLGGSGKASSSLRISFEYCGQMVTIAEDHIQVVSATAAGD